MQHTIIEVLPMKMEFIFLGVTILALGGLILNWVGPSGAAVTDLVSVCEETDNGNNVRMRGYVQHNGWEKTTAPKTEYLYKAAEEESAESQNISAEVENPPW